MWDPEGVEIRGVPVCQLPLEKLYRKLPEGPAPVGVYLLPWGDPPYGTHPSSRFRLRCYLPQKLPVRRVFLMLNGLADSSPVVFDELALEFATAGAASILLPLKGHFNRAHPPYRACHYDEFTPATDLDGQIASQHILNQVREQNDLFVHLFVQAVQDVAEVVRLVQRGQDKSYEQISDWFADDVKICLLGYSLGGLIALGLTVAEREKFSSCFLLESGANLANINAAVLFRRSPKSVLTLLKGFEEAVYAEPTRFSELVTEYKPFLVSPNEETLPELARLSEQSTSAWGSYVTEVAQNLGTAAPRRQVVHDGYITPFVRMQEHGAHIWNQVVEQIYLRGCSELGDKMRRAYEWTFLGNALPLYKKELRELCQKVLIFVGGIDEVYTASSILSFAPKETGLAILQVPNLGHWLKQHQYRTDWDKWRPFIAASMLAFDDKHP